MHSSRMRTARLLTVSKHALRKGGCLPREECVCSGGVCLPREVSAQGSVCPLAVSARGMSAQGRVCSGGVCSGGSAQGVCGRPPCEQNDRQIGVKALPCRNFVAAGNYFVSKVGIIGISVQCE